MNDPYRNRCQSNSVDPALSSYRGRFAEVHISSLQSHCHSSNICSEGYGWLCPRSLRSDRRLWFVVPGTDLLQNRSRESHQPRQIHTSALWVYDSWSNKHTQGVALPPSTSLAIAGAVHHVAFVMPLGKFLVHLIVHTIHDALVWQRWHESEVKQNGKSDTLFCPL